MDGLSEVWIVETKTREPEVFAIVDGAFVALPPTGGIHRSPLLGVTLEVVDGPLLRLRDGDEVTDI